jgi:hypothetical protein
LFERFYRAAIADLTVCLFLVDYSTHTKFRLKIIKIKRFFNFIVFVLQKYFSLPSM